MLIVYYKPSFDGHSSFIKIEGCNGPVCDNVAHQVVDIAREVPSEEEWETAKLLADTLTETLPISQRCPSLVVREDIIPRCQHWPDQGSRCMSLSDGLLYGPDSQPVPGGYYCSPHALASTSEYLEKLGEEWLFVPHTIVPMSPR